jgi:hypothetical protein
VAAALPAAPKNSVQPTVPALIAEQRGKVDFATMRREYLAGDGSAAPPRNSRIYFQQRICSLDLQILCLVFHHFVI